MDGWITKQTEELFLFSMKTEGFILKGWAGSASFFTQLPPLKSNTTKFHLPVNTPFVATVTDPIQADSGKKPGELFIKFFFIINRRLFYGIGELYACVHLFIPFTVRELKPHALWINLRISSFLKVIFL